MKDLNNIEDWYKEELSNYNIEPDKNSWSSLSDELDKNTPLTEGNISEWYKKEAAKLEERPDFTVWEKLATNLDTASVWGKLSASLTRYEQFVLWRNFAIRGTAILLLLVGSYASYQQFNVNNSTIELNKASLSNKNIKHTSKLFLKENLETALAINKAKKEAPRELISTHSKERTVNNTSQLINHSSTNQNIINKNSVSQTENTLKITPIPIHQLGGNSFVREIQEIHKNGITEKDITTGFEKKEFLVKKKKNKIVFNNKRFSSHFAFGIYARRFYLGINLGIKKQGMLTSLKNNPALGAFKQQSFLNFGNSLGATIGWIVSDKVNIETNLNFISTAGYNSTYSDESNTFKQELKLNYTTLSILAKSMSNKSTFDNKKYSTNLIGGIYAGYLNSSKAVINGKTYDNSSISSTDLGIVLGIEQDRYITKSLVITPGFRYYQGLLNIANSSSNYNTARNFSIEFNLGIKYIFLKKG